MTLSILVGAIAWRTHLARKAAPHPQAILMLGGNFDREVFTAEFARQHLTVRQRADGRGQKGQNYTDRESEKLGSWEEVSEEQDLALDIWVSSGLERQKAIAIFQNAGIPNHRLHLDYRAVDTVTNFSTLVPDFKRRNIRHVYLLTSDFHLPRANAIASIILGSQGITFTSIAIPSGDPPESKWRIARDMARSLLWVVTRQTGR
ncbi:YdcF family protein [Lusitaniella coriacea]|nr:YdcF family protein [Lusitaniella coriacea]